MTRILDRVAGFSNKDKPFLSFSIRGGAPMIAMASFITLSCVAKVKERPSAQGNESPSKQGSADSSDLPTGQATDQATGQATSQDTSGAGANLPEDSNRCVEGSYRDCKEYPDGSPIAFPSGLALAPCKMGTQRCVEGQWSACEGAIAPAAADTCEPGNDANCNGRPNEGCRCNEGQTQSCGSDVGACKKGEMRCLANGVWGECKGQTSPIPEICDGIADDNCDGKPDRENCECLTGDTRSCGVSSIGNCKKGEFICNKDGTWNTSECVGEVKPAPMEICNGLGDDNCNGLDDDEECACVAGSSRPCGSKVGECRKGRQKCLDSGVWSTSCDGEIGPSKEVCDGRGLDEDCDGLIDLADSDCQCINQRVTACEIPGNFGDCALGIRECRHGSWSACKPRFYPGRERCGSQHDAYVHIQPASGDEDCDGRVDESDLSQPRPSGCKNYMVDADGDGYGAIGPAANGCYCSAKAAPKGFIPATSKANSDCGDCVDTGKDVIPGRDTLFLEPSPCLEEVGWKGGTFDYNCDGEGKLPHPKVEWECQIQNSECKARFGWYPSIPKCGDHGAYYEGTHCLGHENLCYTSVEPRVMTKPIGCN